MLTVEEQLHRLIAINALEAYGLTVCGNPAPFQSAKYDWLVDPQLGDLVIETSSASDWEMTGGAPGAALGYLVGCRVEPIVSQEQLDAMHADGDWWERPDETLADIPTDTFFYVQPLDRSLPVTRWENCMFIRVTQVARDGDGSFTDRVSHPDDVRYFDPDRGGAVR